MVGFGDPEGLFPPKWFCDSISRKVPVGTGVAQHRAAGCPLAVLAMGTAVSRLSHGTRGWRHRESAPAVQVSPRRRCTGISEQATEVLTFPKRSQCGMRSEMGGGSDLKYRAGVNLRLSVAIRSSAVTRCRQQPRWSALTGHGPLTWGESRNYPAAKERPS